jgi:predicted metal-dependent hydrolase
MPATWNGTLSTARSDALVDHPSLPWPVAIRVHPRARRLKLRLDPDGGRLLLTCPPRSSRKAALDWAASQRAWVDGQLAALPATIPLAPGTAIQIDGRTLVLRHVSYGARSVTEIDGELRCGGPAENFPRRIERWLRGEARRLLSDDTALIAARAGVTVRSVSVGDAGSRWGSCSAAGAIRYNWRLVLAPREVRRWIVAHEVAHRLHMNHGPAFKVLEAELFDGDVDAARSTLRLIGPGLKRVGRGL